MACDPHCLPGSGRWVWPLCQGQKWGEGGGELPWGWVCPCRVEKNRERGGVGKAVILMASGV